MIVLRSGLFLIYHRKMALTGGVYRRKAPKANIDADKTGGEKGVLFVVVEELNCYTQENKYGVKNIGQVGTLRHYPQTLSMPHLIPHNHIPSHIHPHSRTKHNRSKPDQQHRILTILASRILLGPLNTPEVAQIYNYNALKVI